MMFAKVAFVLATISLATAQLIPGQVGGAQYQLIPIGAGAVGYGAGLRTIGLASGVAPAASAVLIGGAAPVGVAAAPIAAAPVASSIQYIRQPAASIQYVAAPQPSTIAIAAPQPRIQYVSAPAPAPASISIQASAPAPAPRPAPISIPAPAPAPRPAAPAPAPRPQPARFQAPPAPAVEDDYYEPGTPVAPYAFSFDETDEYGMNLKRQETSENGIVTGSYSFTTPEGFTRVVNYVSDELGFRAQVQTNEPGTKTSAPADAEYSSTQE